MTIRRVPYSEAQEQGKNGHSYQMSQDGNRPGGQYHPDPNRPGGQYPSYPPHPDAGRPSYGHPTDHPGQYPPYPSPAQWSQAAFPPPSGPVYHPQAPPEGYPPMTGQDGYRLPPPQPMHPSYYQNYQPPPPQPQSAPRQRTAIACRYCRKRKIRCSGFEPPNTKCTNCVRFNQDCVFTPVSSQAQTFVPAHVAYPHIANGQSQQSPGTPNQPPQLYGAHGQPLPPDYAQQEHRNSQGYPYPPQAYPPGGQNDGRSGPPRNLDPSERQRGPEHREPSQSTSGGYDYGDPTNIAPVSPAGPPVYASQPPPSASSYYSHSQQPHRGSPQSVYSYNEPPRTSNSPHDSASSTAGAPGSYRNALSLHSDGRTPPPGQAPAGGRSGMSVRDMLGGPPGGESGNTRAQTDNDMVNALNRGSRRDDLRR